MARWMLSASHIGPSRRQRRWLPFQPAINLGTSNRNRFISRSLKGGGCRLGASGIRNHHGPLIEAGARKNEKINTLVVHGREITTFTNSLEDIVSKRKNYPYRSDPARRMGLKMKKPSRVRFRANRTLSRHRRMTESDPEEHRPKLKSRSARARR